MFTYKLQQTTIALPYICIVNKNENNFNHENKTIFYRSTSYCKC
jgi:hypothetical protein